MSTKKGKRLVILHVLVTYLAISKIVYYFDMITSSLAQGGFSAMGEAVLARLLTQDILIILVILFTLYTDNIVTLKVSKYSNIINSIILHVVDYVLYIAVLFGYFWSINFIFGIFAALIANWWENLIFFSILYLVIVAVVETKKYLKKKETSEKPLILNTDEKLAMLRTLFDYGVLTQDEYDSKKGIL